MNTDGIRYVLTFRTTRDPVPVFARMKRMLKRILRGYGFVAEEIVAVQPDPKRPQADGAGGVGSD